MTYRPFAVVVAPFIATSAAGAGFVLVRARSDTSFFDPLEAKVWSLLVGLLIVLAFVAAGALARIAYELFIDDTYVERPSRGNVTFAAVTLMGLYAATLLIFALVQGAIAPVRDVGQPTEVARVASALSLLAGIPAALSFSVVVHRASSVDRRLGEASGSTLDQLLFLRSKLDRSLIWLATLLSLGVVATAAFQSAMRTACGTTEVDCELIISPDHVWLYGAALSLLLGLLYLPAELALRGVSERFVEAAQAPDRTDNDHEDRWLLPPRAAGALRVEGSTIERLQGPVAVAGPLVTSVVAAVSGPV